MLQQAALLYRRNGNATAALRVLSSAAALYERLHQLDQALLIYQEARELGHDERPTAPPDARLLAAQLACCLRTSNLAAAAALAATNMEAWAPHSPAEAHRAAAVRVVLLLAAGDAVGAERAHRDALGQLDGYMQSDTGEAIGELVDAYQKCDPERLAALQKGSRLMYLDAPVVRLLRDIRLVEASSGAVELEEEPDMT